MIDTKPGPQLRVDPARLAPVREFMARPIGQHGAELDALLDVLRGGPVAGKLCLICTQPHQEWVIGRMSGERNIPPIIEDNRVFRSIEDAERAIFRLRWQAETGVALPDDGV